MKDNRRRVLTDIMRRLEDLKDVLVAASDEEDADDRDGIPAAYLALAVGDMTDAIDNINRACK